MKNFNLLWLLYNLIVIITYYYCNSSDYTFPLLSQSLKTVIIIKFSLDVNFPLKYLIKRIYLKVISLWIIFQAVKY